MKINKAYKFRLNPTSEQELALKQSAGNCRWLWNYFLNLNQEFYKKTGKFIFAHEMTVSIPKLKKENEWLEECFSQSLQQVTRNLDRALKDSFKKAKGFPVFKKKNEMKDSFTVPQKFRIEKNYVFIPKVGEVKWFKHRAIKGKVKSITISQDGTQWFCSVLTELKIKNTQVTKEKVKDVVGIDVGLKAYATFSDGSEPIENPKHLKKKAKKLRRDQKKLNRRAKGSKRQRKQRLIVANDHRKVRNARNDFQNKVTHDIIDKYQGVILEDLNVKGLIKNHKLAKSISDAAWSSFITKLQYKALWNNKIFLKINRFDPSSKTCCKCGWYKTNLKLSDRIFKCENCDNIIDRDLNASINIRNYGIKILNGLLQVPWDARKLSEYKSTLVEKKGSLDSVKNLRCSSMKREKESLSFIKVSLDLIN